MYSKRAAQYHDLGDSVQIQEETIKKIIGCLFRYAWHHLLFGDWDGSGIHCTEKIAIGIIIGCLVIQLNAGRREKNQWLVKIFDIFLLYLSGFGNISSPSSLLCVYMYTTVPTSCILRPQSYTINEYARHIM